MWFATFPHLFYSTYIMKPVFILHVFMKSSLSLSLCCWCLWYPIQEVTTLTSLRNFGLLFSSKNCRVSGLTLRSQTPFWIHFVYVQVEVPVHSSACETRFSQHYLLCWPLLPSCLLLSFLTKHLQLAPPSTAPNRRAKASLLFWCWPLRQALNFSAMNVLFL